MTPLFEGEGIAAFELDHGDLDPLQGLFLVSEPLHGSGIAQRAYGELESWMRGQGAHWLRLGAVAGNDRAERFWHRQGYVETRRRSGVAMGRKVNELIVMVKPIAGGSLEEYLALVPGDRAATPARD